MRINTDKIRQEMERQGLSTTALAYKMDVRESWVYELLAGRQGKTFATVCKVAKALDVPELDLVEGE